MEYIHFILDYLQIDILKGFSLYTIFFGLYYVMFFKNRDLLIQLDGYTCRFISWVGIGYFIVFLISIIFHIQSQEDSFEQISFINRLFGPYWFGVWLQPLTYLLLSQLLRISILKNSITFRFIIIFFFLFNYEQFVIIMTSLHRDYLPSSVSYFSSNIGITWYKFVGHSVLKTSLFICYVLIFRFCSMKLNNPK